MAEEQKVPILCYFDGEGRAELTRLCFKAGGIAFEDRRLTHEEFGALKADPTSIVGLKFGSVPILVHWDLHIAQSVAISQYAADLGINAKVTPAQRAVDAQVALTHEDLRGAMYKCLFGDEEGKAAGAEALPAAVKKFFGPLNAICPEAGFIHGGAAPTLSDMAIYNCVTSKFPGLLALGQDLSAYPGALAVVESVKAFLATKKET
mmetsp:Transcript_7202/g.8127  ORF Transcript_7202/g.8127 Transcript_7202/m.8127 type:complete len:206 (+) Transcript_7202:30-647(+)|eukprot:CAMPEP_0205825284 /NCGR_PEP_ID=MMETSP0206-20130828/24634_1 /ASSEMBLY_ACC=CAM_ASM_000279 /TAXON_ID=36767 /ORGANISM="Euplotes focardii, Strain TN1" /LENGTH=205 /DNA_ID=CAMNT_0053124209 /DNA_START=29 /DNA_END=649 /DNA_ORIENTATION=+